MTFCRYYNNFKTENQQAFVRGMPRKTGEMKQNALLVFAGVLLMSVSYSQPASNRKPPVIYGGIGGGLDYGGLGFKVEYLPVKNIGFFAGAGYNFHKLGVNGGLSWKIFTRTNSTPVLMAMYGYNAVIKVTFPFGNSTFSETYYGFSAGIGYDFSVGANRNKISLAVVAPFRGTDFTNQYDAFKASGYTFSPDVSPILISIGFNIAGYGR